MMKAKVFIHWPALNDNFTSVSFSPQGSSKVAQFPWEQETQRKILLSSKQWHLMPSPTDSAGLHIQVWKKEWEVVVYLFFLRVTEWPVNPTLFHTPSFSFSLLQKNPFSHIPCGHLLTHIFFVCITPLSSSLTQYLPVILSNRGAQVQPCLCISEIVAVVRALRLLWPILTIAPTLSNLQQLSQPHEVTAPVCLTHTNTLYVSAYSHKY